MRTPHSSGSWLYSSRRPALRPEKAPLWRIAAKKGGGYFHLTRGKYRPQGRGSTFTTPMVCWSFRLRSGEASIAVSVGSSPARSVREKSLESNNPPPPRTGNTFASRLHPPRNSQRRRGCSNRDPVVIFITSPPRPKVGALGPCARPTHAAAAAQLARTTGRL